MTTSGEKEKPDDCVLICPPHLSYFLKQNNAMKNYLLFVAFPLLITACNSKPDGAADPGAATRPVQDTLTYPYKAIYSSDITSPGNPVYAQKVLQVWKNFEMGNIQAMKPYFADTVTYDDASGMRFRGSVDKLLAFAAEDIQNLDSMRFDLFEWRSSHTNDKNEDWVNIWSAERRYPKNGKADTILMQENWKIQNGRVVYFNQFKAKPAKG
jgi:hypothetical protein